MTSVFTGFETNELTFTASPEVKPGLAVMIMEDSTVYVPEEASDFCGICSSVKDGYATVVLHGCARASFNGIAPSIGYNKLSVNEVGGIQVDDSTGKDYLVVSVDADTMTLELIV